MTFYLITSLIVTIIIRKITAITSDSNLHLYSEHDGPYDNPKPVPITAEDIDEVKFASDFDNSTDITSQDRISYYTKRGAPYPHRFSHHHHYPHHHHHVHPHQHYHRLPYHRPPRKRYRRGRKKPSMPRLPYMKMPYKRQKPILLSEVLRNGGRLPYSKIKPSGPIIKDYIEDEDLETSPFSTVDAIETYPPFNKLTRPQSFEIADDDPDILPVQPIEEEILFPGISNVKPFTAVVKRPSQSSLLSLSNPSEGYVDNDGSSDSIRNVRFTNKPSYLDKDVMNLLQKIKLEGHNADSLPSSTENTQLYNRDNATDLNVAISKLLFPFLSDTAIKQIQLYFKSLPSDKKHNEDEKNILENQLRDYANRNTTQNPAPNQYSVTESIKEDDSDNSTYFIMVKSPSYKSLNVTKILAQQFNHQRSPENQTENKSETKTTTPPSRESIALQKYIMMLAGLSNSSGNNENYLPRFNAFQKQTRSL